MTRLPTPRRSPLHRPWVVWLAVWLALFASLAPTVNYAFHAAASRDTAEMHAVCSGTPVSAKSGAAPTAPVWLSVRPVPPEDPNSPLSAAADSHCQRCLLSIERLVTLPSSELGFTTQHGTYAEPVAPQPQFVKSFLEFNPPPRGPPTLS